MSAAALVASTLVACEGSLQHERAERELAALSLSEASAAHAAQVGVECTAPGIAAVLAADPSVQVSLVKQFHAGELLTLNADEASFATTLSSDLCPAGKF